LGQMKTQDRKMRNQEKYEIGTDTEGPNCRVENALLGNCSVYLPASVISHLPILLFYYIR